MIPVFCDANVLFSEWQRSLLLEFHHRKIIQPYWTTTVLDECFRNLLRLGRLTEQGCASHQTWLGTEVQSACIDLAPQYEADVRCVDEKDRHVAAAALSLRHRFSNELQTPVTVALWTWNIRDFPRRPLNKLGVLRFTPDEWLSEWVMKTPLDEVLSVFNATITRTQRWREALIEDLPDFQLKASFVPEHDGAWPEFLHRNWFKRSAKCLSRQLAERTVEL